MTISIYGAGMAGLMAANMLRRLNPVVYEAQESLPDNHGALLRFRSNAVGKASGQKVERVNVTKAVMVDGYLREWATLADANRYSLKVSGEAMGRSIINLTGGERYIAPPDFLAKLAHGNDIRYISPLTAGRIETTSEPKISTIPMPALMKMVGWDMPDFRFRPIWSVRADISYPPTYLHQTIYYPEFQPYYRASITGAQLIIEYAEEPEPSYIGDHVREVLSNFGFKSEYARQVPFHDPKLQKLGKIIPIPEEERRAFILAMSDRYNLYSLGRFATWRQILLDDVVHDVEVIESFITERDSYARRKDARRRT